MSRSIRISAAIALGMALTATPALALRVASYNLLNYSGGRTDEFRTVLAEMQPDVLVVEEILSQTAVNLFRTDVLEVVNPGEWSAGPFVNGADTDNGIYYRTAKVDLVGHHVISTALRDIDEWTIRPSSHTSAGAEMRLYVVHLKASTGSTNEAKRLAEVTAMRVRMETFPVGGSYAVTGDFNIYTSTETPYQYMINPANGAAGVVQDPISREGNWHINAAFADIHTQSPRVTQFGGGANGGMDDRFDLILVSPADQDGEGIDALDSTYKALGQDGMHFDGALNVAPFTVVPQAVAMALHDASDHLPVLMEYQMPAGLIVASALDVGSVIVGGTGGQDLAVVNGTPLPADELDYSFDPAPVGFTVPGGSFQLEAGAGANLHAIGLVGLSVGAKNGALTLNTDDPDYPTFEVDVAGLVLDHAAPSVDGGSQLASAPLDLGTVATGGTAIAPAAVHNFGYGALQALLEVYDAQVTGDARFSVPSFSGAAVGASPASWDVQFDAAGASEGAYSGTLTFSTRDQQDLSGATMLSDLVYSLAATVGDGTGVDPASGVIARSGFVSVAPNPFRPRTEITFALAAPGAVDLRVFDVTGRMVRSLTSRAFGPGSHRVGWDGRGADGRELAPGLYFVRLTTPESVETRKVVRVR
ncbi:T9SS type A sorting domain-containing protein [bacterium]|nr:T9SS type A sorting domain-containing protein [bacterium]